MMFAHKKSIQIKRNKCVDIKLKIIKIQLELLRNILHLLLNFKKPTAKIVVSCSQQLDKVIFKYYKVKITFDKVALSDGTSNSKSLNL